MSLACKVNESMSKKCRLALEATYLFKGIEGELKVNYLEGKVASCQEREGVLSMR